MRYEVGDRVRIKSIDWYNENKDKFGNICYKRDGSAYPVFFSKYMSNFCGEILTIKSVFKHSYHMNETSSCEFWTDEMIEGIVERNGKTYPYKIGDRVVLKSNNKCATITDLRYNSQGNLSYFIKIDNDRDINISYPTDLLLPYDNMIEGELTMEETKTKFKVGDRVITDTNMKGKIIEVVEEGWYRVDFDDYNGISQPNGVVPEENMTIMTKETKPEPKFKVGDIIISDVFTTNDDKGWKVIDVERTGYKLISVNNSGLICDMDFKNEHYYKLVEEEMPLDKAGQITDFEYEGLAYTLPDSYQFVDDNGNVINAMKIVVKKKKKEYPKTYEECCKKLGCKADYFFTDFSYNGRDVEISDYEDKIDDLLQNFRKLRYCRDAYWMIAGEEMGLGKPWEPDVDEECFSIARSCREVLLFRGYGNNEVFEFPTKEMRDAFYENFKSLIEQCKELL